MPYLLIPLITSIILGFHHVALSDASRRSRVMVAIVVGASLVLWLRFPAYLVAATLLQVAASIYVLLHMKTTRGAALALALCLALVSHGCGREPLLVEGPIDVTATPRPVRFHRPVAASSTTFVLCFEFELPRDSHEAPGLHAALVAGAGERFELDRSNLDRRGESIVCLMDRLPESAARATFEGVELWSATPLRLRALRGGSG